jgi:hypothetical protein
MIGPDAFIKIFTAGSAFSDGQSGSLNVAGWGKYF